MTGTLLDEPEATPKARKPEPIQLASAHDYGIVADALELRKEDLKKLAKKTTEEGYRREGQVMSNDALALEHHILPAFRGQRELPLVSHEQLEKTIAVALARPVSRAFEGLGDPKVVVTYDGIQHRRETLHVTLAKRVALYVKDAVEEAYRQGAASREQTSESIAARSIETLRAWDD